MSGLAFGIVLALAASLALNIGYLLEHTGLIRGPDISLRHPLSTLRWLLASRPWLAGLAIATLGWGLHIGALSQAPISVVQAFVAGGLALALPVGRWLFQQSLARDEVRGICLLAAALAGLAIGIHDRGPHGSFHSLGLAICLAGSLVAAVLLAAAPARGRSPQALGVAAGILYGAADVAIKALTGLASQHGLDHAFLTPWLPAAALATLGASYLFQRGLQTGRALPVIALMTAVTNALSIAAGFVLFRDPLGRTPGVALVHAAALVVIVAAASRLATAQAERAAALEAG
jgi:energy-converting hydrogenase Eha subunit C